MNVDRVGGGSTTIKSANAKFGEESRKKKILLVGKERV